MFVPAGALWWVSLTLLTSSCALQIFTVYRDEVICSQGLSRCTMKNQMSFPIQHNDAVDVHKLTPHFELCCRGKASCTLCLVIEAELYTRLSEEQQDAGSGPDEEEYLGGMRNARAFVTVCYKTPPNFPTCKKVKFMVNRAALTQRNPAKMSLVITKPAGVSFGSEVIVYPPKALNLSQQLVAPSEEEVCGQQQQQEEEERAEECQDREEMPALTGVDYRGGGWVQLHFTARNRSVPSLCFQYEKNGACQATTWNGTTVPLYAVTPCMCLQVWDEDKSHLHRLSCPFRTKGAPANVSELIQSNVWQNVSVSVKQHGAMLRWNLSAPCRLEGEVRLCLQENSCREERAFRQQLESSMWTQNSKGLWEKRGVFENASSLPSCVMVKVKGVKRELGPFCLSNTGRWRWSLLLVVFMLLVCFTLLIFYLLNDLVKKWASSCRRGGFTRMGRKGRVVLLSPPDVDGGVSESVCRLGSLLCHRGFSVSVDQWCRKQQCTLGPLPWLHSQLLELNGQGGRVVLVLTHKALVRTAEWTQQRPADSGLPQTWSPYSDVFTACLSIITAEKQLGSAAERFLLVTLSSHPVSDRRLPEPLQGLTLFQLPCQIKPLLSELSVNRTERRFGGGVETGFMRERMDRTSR